MKKRIATFCMTLMAMVMLLPGMAWAAGGGGAAIVIVADTRHLDGLFRWWANLYNESHLYFTLLTIILIPITGVLFGLLADVVMHWIGIDLTKRSVAEH